MVVSVWVTVTATLLFTEAPCASAIVTSKVYAPARVNVAVVLLALLLPFAAKTTAAGACVAAQVYVSAAAPPSSFPTRVRDWPRLVAPLRVADSPAHPP